MIVQKKMYIEIAFLDRYPFCLLKLIWDGTNYDQLSDEVVVQRSNESLNVGINFAHNGSRNIDPLAKDWKVKMA